MLCNPPRRARGLKTRAAERGGHGDVGCVPSPAKATVWREALVCGCYREQCPHPMSATQSKQGPHPMGAMESNVHALWVLWRATFTYYGCYREQHPYTMGATQSNACVRWVLHRAMSTYYGCYTKPCPCTMGATQSHVLAP